MEIEIPGAKEGEAYYFQTSEVGMRVIKQTKPYNFEASLNLQEFKLELKDHYRPYVY